MRNIHSDMPPGTHKTLASACKPPRSFMTPTNRPRHREKLLADLMKSRSELLDCRKLNRIRAGYSEAAVTEIAGFGPDTECGSNDEGTAAHCGTVGGQGVGIRERGGFDQRTADVRGEEDRGDGCGGFVPLTQVPVRIGRRTTAFLHRNSQPWQPTWPIASFIEHPAVRTPLCPYNIPTSWYLRI